MSDKLDYLIRELWILAWGASVQRAHLYKEGIGHNSREVGDFRKCVIEYLSSKVLPQYNRLLDEPQHYRNIDGLIDFATRVGKTVLDKEGYKYGVAQKLLNLALKYHWCLGLSEEPPHCPVDRIVISKTKYKGKINWTQITQRAKYEEVIEEVRRLAKAKGLSMAEWELKEGYNRR